MKVKSLTTCCCCYKSHESSESYFIFKTIKNCRCVHGRLVITTAEKSQKKLTEKKFLKEKKKIDFEIPHKLRVAEKSANLKLKKNTHDNFQDLVKYHARGYTNSRKIFGFFFHSLFGYLIQFCCCLKM